MERIGGYLVERKLGEGGMGTVYLARTRGGRAVALKVAKPELAADPVFRERFRAEAEAARRVGGFHTAPVVDADTDGESPWLATAYIPGPTLAAQIAAEGPMDEARLRALAAALAEALESIHSCGLVHRDLKPGNIIMAADGPRVLDFGIARAVESTRLTATGTAFGTPGYLSPEQALGKEVSGATDVFALGAVLVAAAGGNAWGEGTSMALMYRSVHEPPDLSAVPGGLRDAVAACLEKDPAARPTPTALLDVLTDGSAQAGPALYTPTVTVPPRPVAPPLPTGPPNGPHMATTVVPGQPPHVVLGDWEASFKADSVGVTLQVEGVAADFDWSEIAAVTYTPSRRGNRLTVTVQLTDGTSYPCELNAHRPGRLSEWRGQLDRVVGHRLPGYGR